MTTMMVLILSAGLAWCDSVTDAEKAYEEATLQFDNGTIQNAFNGLIEERKSEQAEPNTHGMSEMTDPRDAMGNLKISQMDMPGQGPVAVMEVSVPEGSDEAGVWAAITSAFNKSRAWMFKQWRRLPRWARVFIGGFAIGATGAGGVAFIGGPHVATALIIVAGVVGGGLALLHDYQGRQMDAILGTDDDGGKTAEVVEKADGTVELVPVANAGN